MLSLKNCKAIHYTVIEMMYPKICFQTRFSLLLVPNASNSKRIQYGLAKMHRLKAITRFPPRPLYKPAESVLCKA